MADAAIEIIESPRRLESLAASGMMEPAFEPAFDRLTELVRVALRAPVALISVVDWDRQFFKSHCGLPAPWASRRQTPLSHSFCQHVVSSGVPLLIADAREHALVSQNLAVRDIGVIAYCGMPLKDSEGLTLGSLCAIDSKPREWSADDIELLRLLSLQVSAEIQLRVQSNKLAADLARHQALEDSHRFRMRLNVHDLRTPLSAMLLVTDALKYLGPLNAEQREYLELAERNGQTLLGMVNSLLEIESVEHRGTAALRREPCKPAEVIQAAAEQVRLLAAQKQLLFNPSKDDSLPCIFADCDKVARVLVNLLGNAIKFTPNGGQIEVTASVTDQPPSAVTFSVRDTGIGMSHPEHIFEEGVSLEEHKSAPRSTGLGLTYCKRMVEAHGGRIWFETTAGVGTTFQFTIPTTPVSQ